MAVQAMAACAPAPPMASMSACRPAPPDGSSPEKHNTVGRIILLSDIILSLACDNKLMIADICTKIQHFYHPTTQIIRQTDKGTRQTTNFAKIL